MINIVKMQIVFHGYCQKDLELIEDEKIFSEARGITDSAVLKMRYTLQTEKFHLLTQKDLLMLQHFKGTNGLDNLYRQYTNIFDK